MMKYSGERTMQSLKYKRLISAVLGLIAGLVLTTAFGSNVALANELSEGGSECGVLTVEMPLQPEVEPFPPGPGDPVNPNPDLDKTDGLNQVEQHTGKNPVPACPQWDGFQARALWRL